MDTILGSVGVLHQLIGAGQIRFCFAENVVNAGEAFDQVTDLRGEVVDLVPGDGETERQNPIGQSFDVVRVGVFLCVAWRSCQKVVRARN